MARTFNGSSDKLLLALGSVPTAPTNLTMAAIVRRNSAGTFDHVVGFYTSADASVCDMTLDSGFLSYESSATFGHLISGIGTGWMFVAITKTAGTTAPRGHLYVYSTGVWTHTNDASTRVDPSGTVTKVWMGAFGGSADWFDGDIACAGLWGAALSDAAIENLPFTLQAWYAANPAALWLLDQSATTQKVKDLVGLADETTLTGTTVASASVPVFNYTDGVWVPTIVKPAAGGALQIAMNAVASGEAWGTPIVRRSLNILAASSTEAWGTPTLRRIVSQLASVSGEAWGSPSVQRLVRSLAVASSEAWGSPTVRRLMRAAAGASSETFGTPFVRRIVGNVGIASSESLGRPLIIGGIIGNTISILVGAIASAEAWGNPKVQRIARAQGITTAEQFGILTAQRISKTLAIPSSEQVARPTLQRVMRAAAIQSAEQVGIPKLSRFLIAVNIATGETFGSPVVIGGAVVDFPSVVGAMLLSDRAAYEILLIDGETFAIGIADSAAFDILLGEDRGG